VKSVEELVGSPARVDSRQSSVRSSAGDALDSYDRDSPVPSKHKTDYLTLTTLDYGCEYGRILLVLPVL
jgi:hypothetical protein